MNKSYNDFLERKENIEIQKIIDKHNRLRTILTDFGVEKVDNSVIDMICELFEYPNTLVYIYKNNKRL